MEIPWLHFGVQASSSLPLRVDLAVLDQRLETEADGIVASFPDWVAVVAGTSYLSTYTL